MHRFHIRNNACHERKVGAIYQNLNYSAVLGDGLWEKTHKKNDLGDGLNGRAKYTKVHKPVAEGGPSLQVSRIMSSFSIFVWE